MKKRLLLILLLLTFTVSTFGAEPYQVIVNADNPITSMTKATLRDYFLGKATRWSDGSSVKPIDLPEASNTRARFSKEVLGKDATAVKSYWLTMIFSGRGVPPLQLDSDEQVLSNVRSTPGAIGYVSPSTAVGGGVRVVAVSK